MCCGCTTHLHHMIQIWQIKKWIPRSHYFHDSKSTLMLLCHDDVITPSYLTKLFTQHKRIWDCQRRPLQIYQQHLRIVHLIFVCLMLWFLSNNQELMIYFWYHVNIKMCHVKIKKHGHVVFHVVMSQTP